MKKVTSMFLTMALVFSLMSIFIPHTKAETITAQGADFVHRSDGIWYFPLPSQYYNRFSDWAGCPGYGTCPFHNVSEPQYGDNYHTGQAYGHNGFDVGTGGNKCDVYAAASGTAYCSYSSSARGYYIVVEHSLGNGYSYYSYYQHLSAISVENGTTVTTGQTIGKVGNTGGDYGIHLHFGIVLGTSGRGINAPNSLEKNGWVLTSGFQEGRICNNPALNSPAGFPTGNITSLRPHAGSVMYTFNISEVAIGSGNDDFNEYQTLSCEKCNYKIIKAFDWKDGPYASANTVGRSNVGETVTVVEVVKNKYDNMWVKCSNGYFIYGGYKLVNGNWNQQDNQHLQYISDQGWVDWENCNMPSSLPLGKSFSLRGTLTSSSTIISVRGDFETSNSCLDSLATQTFQVNSKSYSMYNSDLDHAIKFDKLSARDYYKLILTIKYKCNRGFGEATKTIERTFSVAGSVPPSPTPTDDPQTHTHGEMVQRLRDSNFVFNGQSYAYRKSEMISMAEKMLDADFEPAYVAGMLGNSAYEASAGVFENVYQYSRDYVRTYNPHHYIAHMNGYTEWCNHGHDHSEYRQYAGKRIYNGFSLSAVSNLLSQYQAEGWNAQFGLGSLQWSFSKTITLVNLYRQEAGGADTITYDQCVSAEQKMIINELRNDRSRTHWREQNQGNLESADSAYNAAYLICTEYEIPGNTINQAIMRGNVAREVFKVMVPDAEPTVSTLQFIDVVYPWQFRIDTTYGWYLQGGTLASNVELSSIRSEIRRRDGTLVDEYGPITISGKSYAINNRDFDSNIKFNKITTPGDYDWILIATDSAGHTLSMDMPITAVNSGSTQTATMSRKPSTDTEAPSVSNIQVSDVSPDGYTVTCNVYDNVGVTRVVFPTITDGESEFRWADGSLSGNTASFRVNTSDHGGRFGNYRTEVYAYDAQGNCSPYNDSIIVNVEVPCIPGKPSISIEASDELHEVVFRWNETDYTDAYGVYIFRDDGTKVYEHRVDTTQFAALLPAGSYQVEIGAMNNYYGTWNGSGRQNFSVGSTSISDMGALRGQAVHNGHLYELYEKNVTWLGAERLAKQNGGFLVEINTQTEQDTVAKMVASFGERCWIGAESYRNEEWRWISGSTMGYTNWYTGEPNNADGVECCAEIQVGGLWNDVPNSCSMICGYIVEYLPVSVTGVSLNRTTMSLNIGGTSTLTANVTPTSATIKSVTWTSSDTVTATVSNGNVTGKAVGVATITVKTNDGGKTATCKVIVRDTAPMTLPAKLTNISEEAFTGIGAREIIVPSGVKSIGAKAFANCTNLRLIWIPDSVTTIARNAFTSSSNVWIIADHANTATKYAAANGIQWATLDGN